MLEVCCCDATGAGGHGPVVVLGAGGGESEGEEGEEGECEMHSWWLWFMAGFVLMLVGLRKSGWKRKNEGIVESSTGPAVLGRRNELELEERLWCKAGE